MLLDAGTCRQAATRQVDDLPVPPQAWRQVATIGPAGRDIHDRLLADSGAFSAVRVRQPNATAAVPPVLRIAAWNMERCKHVEASAGLLSGAGADIVLATEMDIGMARAANRDTPAELAGALDMGHAFGVEFIEMGLGDNREQDEHAGARNACGLHGNAVLSRFPIDRAALLPLDAGGDWFTEDGDNDQRRIGGRMAMAVRLLLPQPAWFIAAHFESRLGPMDRARETRFLLDHIGQWCCGEPVLLGGDFNCFGLWENELFGSELLERPADVEPMFGLLADAGFTWQSCNTEQMTTRNHPWSRPGKPLIKIDWFFARGLACADPAVVPAVGPDGVNLSDHELILTDLSL